MIRTAVLKLSWSDINNPLSCSFGYLMYKAKQILIWISKSHSSADTAFVIWCTSWHIKGHHTLIRIPYVYHTVKLFIIWLKRKYRKKIIPVRFKLIKFRITLCRWFISCNHFLCLCLIYYIKTFKFLIIFILNISENKYVFATFSCVKWNINPVRCNRIPAGSYWISATTVYYTVGIVKTVKSTKKSISIRIKSTYLSIYGIESIVIPSLPILCFMIYSVAIDFHLTCIKVTLIVKHIILGIPKTEFNKWKQIYVFRPTACICHLNSMYFTVIVHRNKSGLLNADAISLTGNFRVTHTVTALIKIKFFFHWHIWVCPTITVIVYVKIASTVIRRDIIVSVSQNSSVLCILVETIAAGSIWN